MDDNVPKTHGILYLALGFAALTAGLIWLLGATWVGVIAAMLISGFVMALIAVSHRSWREKRGGALRGNVACPECGSLQTDAVQIPQPDGSEKTAMRCFACDHEFDPPTP